MLSFWTYRTARKNAAKDLAGKIVTRHGEDAYSIVRLRLVDRARLCQDTSFDYLVKREIDLLLGTQEREDTATRYIETERNNR